MRKANAYRNRINSNRIKAMATTAPLPNEVACLKKLSKNGEFAWFNRRWRSALL
jgi:hypothetical protein